MDKIRTERGHFPMNTADELRKLHELHQSGAIDADEFVRATAKLLSAQEGPPYPADSVSASAEVSGSSPLQREARRWAMLLHFSVLAGFVAPVAGLVLPILIWQFKKVELPGIDAHGRNAVNWIISLIIYAVISGILVLAFIGIFMLIALGVVALIFPVIAGIKANDGEVWKYPLAIPFLK
jgi:uncharacterized Tic20 family protein